MISDKLKTAKTSSRQKRLREIYDPFAIIYHTINYVSIGSPHRKTSIMQKESTLFCTDILYSEFTIFYKVNPRWYFISARGYFQKIKMNTLGGEMLPTLSHLPSFSEGTQCPWQAGQGTEEVHTLYVHLMTWIPTPWASRHVFLFPQIILLRRSSLRESPNRGQTLWINECSLSSYMAPGPSSRPARTNLTHKNVQVYGSC